MGCLYKIENTVNGKCYYGQTIMKPERRKGNHFSELKRGKHGNKHLQSSWNKHGESAFTFTVISDSEADNQLDQLEKQLIEIFQTMNPNYGYNKESGGNTNKKHSDETKKKMSEAKKGKSSPNKGRKQSPEQIEANSQARLKFYKEGGAPHNKGKKMSPESVEKNRQARLKWYANGGVHPMQGKKHKPLNMTPIIGPDGFICPSIAAAAFLYKCETTRLSNSIKNNKPYKGMTFSYLT